MFGSIFAFLPWHSAIELRRYLLRFFHLLPTMGSMTKIQRTRYNQKQAIVEPLTEWLRRLGVNFHTDTLVTYIVHGLTGQVPPPPTVVRSDRDPRALLRATKMLLSR
jgi:oleate hydratase